MLSDAIQGKWIDLFAEVFQLCKVARDEPCAILSESQSRPLNVQLAELALHRLGARPFHVVVPTPRQSAPVPIRSTLVNRPRHRSAIVYTPGPVNRWWASPPPKRAGAT